MSSVPLWQYCRDGNLAQVDRLTRSGKGKASINTIDKKGWNVHHPPLSEAAKHGHVDVLNMLLDRGADINIKSHAVRR